MEYWVKAQNVDQKIRQEYVVGICDKELLGKELNKDTKISEYFFRGKLVGKEEALKELKKATTANIFGNNAIEMVVEAGLIERKDVKEISGVKYALIFSLG